MVSSCGCSIRCASSCVNACMVDVRLTMEMSHAGPVTRENPRLPGKPLALSDVGSSDLRPNGWRLSHKSPSSPSLLRQVNPAGRLPVVSTSLVAVDPRETLNLALSELLGADYLLHGHFVLDRCVTIVKLVHSAGPSSWLRDANGNSAPNATLPSVRRKRAASSAISFSGSRWNTRSISDLTSADVIGFCRRTLFRLPISRL